MVLGRIRNLKLVGKKISMVSNGYLEAGYTDKAVEMLYEVEGTIPPCGNRFAARYVITHFASVGYNNDVYRVWFQNKLLSKQLNTYANCMISALAKFDDIDGAEMILKEWESGCDQYEFEVVNQLANAYCGMGLVDKAKLMVENKLAEGRESCSSTWRILAGGYASQKCMPKQKSLSDIRACFDYLEERADHEGLGEMAKLFKLSRLLTINIYHRLFRANIAAGKCAASILLLMEADGFVANIETQKVLQKRRAVPQS